MREKPSSNFRGVKRNGKIINDSKRGNSQGGGGTKISNNARSAISLGAADAMERSQPEGGEV